MADMIEKNGASVGEVEVTKSADFVGALTDLAIADTDLERELQVRLARAILMNRENLRGLQEVLEVFEKGIRILMRKYESLLYGKSCSLKDAARVAKRIEIFAAWMEKSITQVARRAQTQMLDLKRDRGRLADAVLGIQRPSIVKRAKGE